jgi:hypothetical protein
MMAGKSRHYLTTLVFTVLVGCVVVSVAASQEVTGRLEGHVLTADGDPLAAARIILSGPAMQGTRETATDRSGRFRVPGLPVGRYTVRISSIGYRGVVYQSVQIRLGSTTTLGDVRLETETFQLSEIVVRDDRPAIDPTSTTFGANLATEEFEVLPIDRDYRSIVALLPQANTSYLGDGVNIAGATGLGNVFFIDGVNVTDPSLAATSTRLPYNFVKEIQVKEGGYEAEFGKALGGIVNVVTHSGGNELRAGAFAYFTNGALAADGRPGVLDLTLRDFATYDVGLSVSGPLLRDRLWFFAAYNPSFEKRELEIPGFGFHDDRLISHRFAGKLTWQPSNNTSLMFTAFGDPTRHHRVGLGGLGSRGPAQLSNPDPLLSFLQRGAVNVSAQSRTVLGSRAVIEGSIARTEQAEEERGDTEQARSEPRFVDIRTNTWSGGVETQGKSDIARTSARIAATMFLGSHTVKVGAEYEENVSNQMSATTDPGIILQTGDASFEVVRIISEVEVRNRVPTVYWQDSWRATRRLTLNGGIRWDGQYLIGVGDSVAQSITDQFQPRLGLTFQPGEMGSQKIFASYGRFYEQLPLFWSRLEHGGQDHCVFDYTTDPRTGGPPDSLKYCLNQAGVARSPKVEGLDGQHFDEFTLGYERALGSSLKVSLRGVYRTLRAVIGVGIAPPVVAGNTGRGALDFLPEPERDYAALELTATKFGESRLDFQVSYTLSRTHGNYTGLFASDVLRTLPNWNAGLQLAEQGTNSTGLLPNDRTHVFKAVGSYRVTDRFTAGTFFTWQSGTPLNEYGASIVDQFFPVFLVKRGSAGRTPAIWDLNFRLAYDLNRPPALSRGRIVLDLLHIGNPRTAVVTDQFRFQGRDRVDGSHIFPNPSFGGAIAHQAPMTLRLGIEMGLGR